MNDKPNYQLSWTQPYKMSVGWRKRQIVEQTLNELHSMQLDMIDEALEKSNLQEAKEVIEYIRNKA